MAMAWHGMASHGCRHGAHVGGRSTGGSTRSAVRTGRQRRGPVVVVSPALRLVWPRTGRAAHAIGGRRHVMYNTSAPTRAGPKSSHPLVRNSAAIVCQALCKRLAAVSWTRREEPGWHCAVAAHWAPCRQHRHGSRAARARAIAAAAHQQQHFISSTRPLARSPRPICSPKPKK